MTDTPTLANVEAEAALLGALMQSAKLIDPVADNLSPGDFSEPLHGRIYAAIIGQHSLGKAANPITLKPHFENDAAMNEVGGAGYLGKLTGNSMVLVGARDFAAQVRDLAARRRLVAGLTETIAAAGNLDAAVDDLAAQADNAISALRDTGGASGEYSAAEALDLALKAMESPRRGVRCGRIPPMDSLLGPMRPGDLVIGAGRPGMGKSALASAYSLGVAEGGAGCLFVSLEMSALQLAERMASDLCFDAKPVPYSLIRDGKLNTDNLRQVIAAKDRLAKMPLAIVDRSGLTISALRRLVKRYARRFQAQGNPLGLVVVDYLQLLRPDSKLNAYEAASEVSRALKEIAKEHGVAVFALAQLSREVERRPDKRPQLSDLRESGQIEQDADAVIFLLRQEYYLRQNDCANPAIQAALAQCEGKVELILAKRRNGPTGSLAADFHAQFQAVR